MSLWVWMITLIWRGVMYDKIFMPVFLFLLRGLVPFLCLFVWVPPLFSMGDVFQWTDSRGVIHFTDNYQAVPEPLRGSPRLIVREDLHISGEFSETLPLSEKARKEPVPETRAPEMIRSPEPKPVKPAPQIIYNSQHFTTIVVVNSFLRQPKKKRCLLPGGCRPAFRPNFKDRRFIHPSVFRGGTRQYIHPRSFQ